MARLQLLHLPDTAEANARFVLIFDQVTPDDELHHSRSAGLMQQLKTATGAAAVLVFGDSIEVL
jgi:hypothetical protein